MAEGLKSLLAHRVSGLSGGSQATGVIELGLVMKMVDINCSNCQSMLCSCSCGYRTGAANSLYKCSELLLM